jgi:excisionase family DNA binding protein
MSRTHINVTCPHCDEEHEVDVSHLQPNPSEERFYSVTAVARMMGASRLTVKRWIYDKKLHAVRLPGRTTPWRIPASSLANFQQQHRTYQSPS